MLEKIRQLFSRRSPTPDSRIMEARKILQKIFDSGESTETDLLLTQMVNILHQSAKFPEIARGTRRLRLGNENQQQLIMGLVSSGKSDTFRLATSRYDVFFTFDEGKHDATLYVQDKQTGATKATASPEEIRMCAERISRFIHGEESSQTDILRLPDY